MKKGSCRYIFRLLILSICFHKLAAEGGPGWGWVDECKQPCQGENCARLKAKVENLLDLNSDPCDDFYKFACNVADRGKAVPPVKQPLLTFEQLVENPPQGFDYVKRFYTSCTGITTQYSSSEVLFGCTQDGDCTEEELLKHGRVYVDFIRKLKIFATKTAFPVVTPNWEEKTSEWFGGQGWNWWDFAAQIYRNYFFLATFQYTDAPKEGDVHRGVDVFIPNLFFVPMIDTTTQKESLDDGDLLPLIHIVPMYMPKFLRDSEKAKRKDPAAFGERIFKYKALMGALLGFLSSNATTLQDDIDRIVQLELELGEIDKEDYWRSNDSWEVVTVQQLSRLVPTVEWKDYIQSCLKTGPTKRAGSCGEDSNYRVKRHTRVKIPSRKLMVDMGKFIKRMEENRRDQANMLIWRMMIMFANNFMHTGESNSDTQDDIFGRIDPKARKSRSSNCLTQLRTFFPGVEDDMLIAKYISPETKRGIQRMFSGVKVEFGNIIKENEWMTDRTKYRAREKLNATTLLIGELLPSTTEFEQLKKRMTSDYIGNVQAIGAYKWDTLSKTLDSDKLVSRGYEEEQNAYYYPYFNFVRVKTGLLNGLLGLGFSLFYPPSLLYGGFVAATLGHELTHGFDSNGRMFDKEGFALDWWERKDEEAFDNRTGCMVDQYENFPIMYKGQNYTTGGSLCELGFGLGCAGEDISDNGGVKTAYRAFQKIKGSAKEECIPGLPFSANQLFWLGYAMDWCSIDYERYPSYEGLLSSGVTWSGHSPSPYRVNVVLANLPQFANDFKCPLGSRLHPPPEDRCDVW